MYIQTFLGLRPDAEKLQRYSLANTLHAFRQLCEANEIERPKLGGLPIETIGGSYPWWPMLDSGGWHGLRLIRDDRPEWQGTLLSIEAPRQFGKDEFSRAMAQRHLSKFWVDQTLEPVEGLERYFDVLQATAGELPSRFGVPRLQGVFDTPDMQIWLGWFPHSGPNPTWELISNCATAMARDKMKGI